jgi:D-alanyl-D-alanine carboxypeptidase
MTALVALQNGSLSDEVKVSRNAAYTEGSSMYLKVGETLTLETLLYGLMLCSGNDAAVAIAEHIGGSAEQFAKMMNETAQGLGMSSTSFANPNGLDHENHYSTARDMAMLARAAMENETLVRIVSTKQITIGGRSMSNHNKLLSYQSGCIGLKTGYTKAAGRTLVSCAEKNGQRLVVVTLQDGNDWVDHQALFDYGFSAYPLKRVATMGQVITKLPVSGGEKAWISLVAGKSFAWPVGTDESLETEIKTGQKLSVPLIAGTIVGEAVFSLDGYEVGRVELLCGETVMPRVGSAMNFLKLYLPQ